MLAEEGEYLAPAIHCLVGPIAWISQTISVHRGRESEKAIVLQQFLSGSGTPRCGQSVRRSGLNLKRLRAARWLTALMVATSPRMRERCYWGKSIVAWS